MRRDSSYPNESSTFFQRRDRLPLHGLAALRILIVLMIGLGYASTMGLGTESFEWGHHWGYDPSWYGLQLLFLLSGFLAARSMTQGRTIVEFFKSRLFSLWPALLTATLVTVLIIYPLMCAPDAPVKMDALDLTAYFFKTVFLIDPGSRMPGLLDDAKYMCLMQGAIWTLRWGLILHVAFLFGWMTKLLQNRHLALVSAVLGLAGYVSTVFLAVKFPAFAQIIEPVLPGIRLGYIYLCGVALFSWQHKLPRRLFTIWIIAALLGAAATFHYHVLPWTPLIEILGTAFWATLCIGFLTHAPLAMRRCPRLAPVLYVTIWPAAQIIVALVPELNAFGVIEFSVLLASSTAVVGFLLLRQARIQPTRL
ncbi:hypothetical protein [Litorimonas sp. WD9-15]|uniref:hypothetical protein n=1 Tax=Litorimonas sp. WD9-15 TaxID=3418716 RepID=UPI003CFBCE12